MPISFIFLFLFLSWGAVERLVDVDRTDIAYLNAELEDAANLELVPVVTQQVCNVLILLALVPDFFSFFSFFGARADLGLTHLNAHARHDAGDLDQDPCASFLSIIP